MNHERGRFSLRSPRAAAAVVFSLVLLVLAGSVFSQTVTTAGKDDLQVPPPGYAKFGSALTQTVVDLFNSPIMKAQQELSAEEMGGYALESLKLSCFTTDRSIEDVAGYFSGKLGQEAGIETGALVDPPDEMREMEQMTGLSWDKTFMKKYEKAYEEYTGETSQKASFSAGIFSDKLVSIEIESPYLDVGSLKKVNKTSMVYMVFKFKKK